MDFTTTSVADIAAAVRRREIAAREVTAASLDAIDRLDGTIGAFVVTDPDGALAAAAALDEALAGGADPAPLLLAGVPVGIKDLEDAQGLRTTRGSALFADAAPAPTDSPSVAAMRAAGAIVVGKTNTPEDGHTAETDNAVVGATVNPLDERRSAGGSSGGSAAALAAGMVPLATGSDGGGSIRIPASLCGLTGFKPTQGLVPTGPEPPGSNLLSTRGPMAHTAAEAALALSVVASGDTTIDPFASAQGGTGLADLRPTDPADHLGRGRPLRVVWIPDGGFEVDDAVRQVTRAAVDALADAGAEVVERDRLFSADPLGPWWTLWTSAMAARHGERRGTPDWDRLWPGVQDLAAWGLDRVSGSDVTAALDGIWVANSDVTAALGNADVLVLPTVAGRVPLSGRQGTINGTETPMWVRFTYPFNLTRHPAGSVRAGADPDGMPVGLQVLGRHHHDAEVLAVLAACEVVLAGR